VSTGAEVETPTRDCVHWGRTAIHYEISYRARKTLAISVHPDLRVSVAAPLGADPETIRAKVLKHAAWIRAQWRELGLYLPKQPPRRYINGETHRYLGRQYRLRAVQGPENSVKCLRGYFHVTTRLEPTPTVVQRRLEDWFRDRAEIVFGERLEVCQARAAREGIARPVLKIKRMLKRWGSCAMDGTITLNVELIQAPKDCIDYVIKHELCHLKEPHHGPRFWALLSKLMPDYEQQRERLNRVAAQPA
jgi:predicted metal-dependent hydrolase